MSRPLTDIKKELATVNIRLNLLSAEHDMITMQGQAMAARGDELREEIEAIEGGKEDDNDPSRN